MPLDLIKIDVDRKFISSEDKGFIVSVAKSRWTKTSSTEATKLLNTLAQKYYFEKCPESQPVEPIVEEIKEETPAKMQTEESEETRENQTSEEPQENKPQEETNNVLNGKNNSPIQFVHRKQAFPNCGFYASNLADPADFAYYIMHQFAGPMKDVKIRLPFRVMPVQAICEARARSVEKAAMPLVESIFGQDEQPYRFSMMYRGKGDGDYLTQQEAKALIRNCVWAVNPNCVQCIKYQDYAIIIDLLNPYLCIGIAKDFQRLAGYNIRAVKLGLDLTDLGEDSEDEISDDPTLDEESEKRRKLRIKRKRRAEMAGASQLGDSKKAVEGEAGYDDNEDGHGHDLEAEHEIDAENGI